jgi:hypothetical protein
MSTENLKARDLCRDQDVDRRIIPEYLKEIIHDAVNWIHTTYDSAQ